MTSNRRWGLLRGPLLLQVGVLFGDAQWSYVTASAFRFGRLPTSEGAFPLVRSVGSGGGGAHLYSGQVQVVRDDWQRTAYHESRKCASARSGCDVTIRFAGQRSEDILRKSAKREAERR